MTPFETTVRVRYAETDAMGVVHHASYFVWLEYVRVEWLKACGLDYKKLDLSARESSDCSALPIH